MPYRESRQGWKFVPALLVFSAFGFFLLFGVFAWRGFHRKDPPDARSIGGVFSQPRVMVHPWTRHEVQRLQRLLDARFAPMLHSKQNGFIVLASNGSVLYDRNGSLPRAPASTLKVLTATTALRVLGADYRFVTRLAALDPIEDGVLDGDLYIIGGGDPVLSSGNLHQSVMSLKRIGLHKIMGHVVVDTTAFVGPEQNPHWEPDDLNLEYAAGTSALSLDGDLEIFHLRPRRPGQAAQVRLEPQNDEAMVRGAVLTVNSGRDSNVCITHVAGRNAYWLSGRIASGGDQSVPLPVGNVGTQVGGVLDTMLRRQGIEVLMPARVDAAPFGAQILWQYQSHPLREIVHHMLLVSDNHFAEQLLRTIAAATGHQGTEAEGIGVETALLRKLSVDDRGMRLYDGSGLSPSDRIAPRTLATVIVDALGTPGSPLIAGLPRVGIEGTVRGHTLKTSYGRVRAKSGHISGVDGLVGAIQTHRHGTLAFAFVTNEADDGTVEDAEDAAFDGLMHY